MEAKNSKDLAVAQAAARRVACVMRAIVNNLNEALLSVDTLLEASEKEPDVQKATGMAETAAILGYKEQEKLTTVFLAAMAINKDSEEAGGK